MTKREMGKRLKACGWRLMLEEEVGHLWLCEAEKIDVSNFYRPGDRDMFVYEADKASARIALVRAVEAICAAEAEVILEEVV